MYVMCLFVSFEYKVNSPQSIKVSTKRSVATGSQMSQQITINTNSSGFDGCLSKKHPLY